MAAASSNSNLPRHVAIIMDGNGRWARKRHLPRQAGHVAGVAAVRNVVRKASDIGLENLTLFAFSSENWKRPATEVGALMGLFRLYFRNDLDELIERGVRMRIIGNRVRVDEDIRKMIEDAERRTLGNNGITSPLPSTTAVRRKLPPPRANLRGPPPKAGSTPKRLLQNC